MTWKSHTTTTPLLYILITEHQTKFPLKFTIVPIMFPNILVIIIVLIIWKLLRSVITKSTELWARQIGPHGKMIPWQCRNNFLLNLGITWGIITHYKRKKVRNVFCWRWYSQIWLTTASLQAFTSIYWRAPRIRFDEVIIIQWFSECRYVYDVIKCYINTNSRMNIFKL